MEGVRGSIPLSSTKNPQVRGMIRESSWGEGCYEGCNSLCKGCNAIRTRTVLIRGHRGVRMPKKTGRRGSAGLDHDGNIGARGRHARGSSAGLDHDGNIGARGRHA